VVGAGEVAPVAGALAAKAHATVGADVLDDVDAAVEVACQDHRALADDANAEVARVRDLGLEADVAPVPAVEEALELEAVQRLAGVAREGDAAGALVLPGELAGEHGSGCGSVHRGLSASSTVALCLKVDNPVPRAESARPPAGAASGPIMIAQALVVLACLIAPAMTLAQSSPNPPVAPREPRDVTVHDDRRIDDYFWLRKKDDPRTLPYLRTENAYADAWFAPHAALKEKLYQEMFGRIQQDDDSVPYRKGGWWYSSRTLKGDQYPRYIRRRAVGSDRSYDPSGQGTRRCST
jgi:hypothetical protein